MRVFRAATANEAWLKAAHAFRHGEGVHTQQSRAGNTREILAASFEIKEPRQRWITARQPAMNPAFALAEVVWIASGRQDATFLNFWNPLLPKFAGKGRRYYGAYGHRLKHAHKVDQLTRAYQALSENPDSRQVVLQIWHPSLDLPKLDGSPASPDIPCNICSLLKIRDGKLEWTQILRSNDLVLGVPHNFVQFTSLQEIMAAWLGLPLGTYRHFADCLHVYERDEQLMHATFDTMAPMNTDRLRFSKADSDQQFASLAKRMQSMISPRLSPGRLKQIVFRSDLNPELQNWLLVLAADCARRHSWIDLTQEVAAACANPLLGHLWNNWYARTLQFRKPAGAASEQPVEAQGWLPLRYA